MKTLIFVLFFFAHLNIQGNVQKMALLDLTCVERGVVNPRVFTIRSDRQSYEIRRYGSYNKVSSPLFATKTGDSEFSVRLMVTSPYDIILFKGNVPFAFQNSTGFNLGDAMAKIDFWRYDNFGNARNQPFLAQCHGYLRFVND